MFTFLKWRAWLTLKADALRSEGLEISFKENDRCLKSSSLEVNAKAKIACFRNFENGLVDYEIMDTASGEFLANEAMISVNDENFEQVFGRFWEAAQG